MVRYKLRRKNWFEDALVGLKMMLKRKLDLLPSKNSAWLLGWGKSVTETGFPGTSLIPVPCSR